MDVPTNILKSAFLSAIIFWVVILSESFESSMITLIFLSIIPIFICCAITISITIVPFFWLKREGTSNKEVFKKYFPFYAITCFALCFYCAKQNTSAISFFISAFFTTMQSWVWFAKSKSK